ncbi:hypothetical protein JHK87_014654 [Glycine soja]|nr:hypothetical protein JHK87_014654 [Glycine soja]
MDGQLGINGEESHDNEYAIGENSLVPCLQNKFLELHPPDSSSTEGGLALVSSFTPSPVWDFQGHTVVKVACGNEHVVARVSAGEAYNGEDLVCYSWGYNSRGQLGLGDRESRLHPEVVRTFDEESPYAFHNALLTHKKKSCDNGDVWSWGMEKGLGLCPDASRAGTDSGDALSPCLMSCKPQQPKFPDPVKVACGAAHTVIVAREGYRMWSWGRGRSGALGDGKGLDCYTPMVMLWPSTMEDFEEEEVKSSGEQDKAREKDTEVATETEEKLSSALNELRLLQTKLSIMEKYASILHGSVFGKPFDEQDIPVSLRNSGSFDIAKEWEAADQRKLSRLEMFCRHMLTGVKDELMKRRIKEIVKECLQSSEVKK